jgi:hypothetical protein
MSVDSPYELVRGHISFSPTARRVKIEKIVFLAKTFLKRNEEDHHRPCPRKEVFGHGVLGINDSPEFHE